MPKIGLYLIKRDLLILSFKETFLFRNYSSRGRMNFLKPCHFLGVDFISLEQFSVHSQAEKKVQGFPVCLPRPASAPPPPDGAFVTIDEPAWTRHPPPQSSVCTRVPLDGTRSGFAQLCDDTSHHDRVTHHHFAALNPLCSTCLHPATLAATVFISLRPPRF